MMAGGVFATDFSTDFANDFARKGSGLDVAGCFDFCSGVGVGFCVSAVFVSDDAGGFDAGSVGTTVGVFFSSVVGAETRCGVENGGDVRGVSSGPAGLGVLARRFAAAGWLVLAI